MARHGRIATLMIVACALFVSPAMAGLPSIPSLPPVSVPTLPPVVTGTVGGVVTTTTGTVTGVIDGVLGALPGSTGSTLPTGAVGDLVSGLLGDAAGAGGSGTGAAGADGSSSAGSNGSNGSTGTSGSGSGGATGAGGAVDANGNPIADTVAPKLKFKILSRLRAAARTGRLRLRVTSSETSVVAFNGLLRPGKGRRVHRRALHVSHKLIRTKATLMVFKRAGALTVTVKLTRSARRTLARTTAARISLQAWAADLARNQARKNVKRSIRR
jgi:hypothetical protein